MTARLRSCLTITMKRRFPDAFYNPLSLAGAVLAGAVFITIVFLTAVEILQANAPAYIGIISYVILPVPLVLGLLLVVGGLVRERRKIKRGEPASRLQFVLDLNSPRQRTAAIVVSAVVVMFLLFSAYVSYRTFEWTESVAFCGTTCHEVMEPEYTAYQASPHARVKCVECHVGSGAGWYLRSKLSGAYQVYAVLADVYPRPIATPIKNLRPAQETCEQCHWPSHFSGGKEVVNTYFRSDDKNSRWTVALLMKIGGGNNERGAGSGIHWHMNIANEITYVSADSLHQTIPWVQMRSRATGEVRTYTAGGTALNADTLARMPKFRMDCIDCHNRPSHIYRPPVRIVDRSLAAGRMSPAIPGIRAIAVDALVQPYSTAEAAADSIPKVMRASYEGKFGAIADSLKPLFATAVKEVVDGYRQNFFPRMSVSWKAYPNNIGHMTDLGCFRCHDGQHASPEGKVISRECNTCHTLEYQGSDATPATVSIAGAEFQHPEDIGDAWKTTNCKECHSGQ